MNSSETEKDRIYAGHQGFLPSHKVEFLSSIEGKVVLDVGCGVGQAARFLQKKNNRVFGITYSEKEALLAEQWMEKVCIADINQMVELPFEDIDFDVVIFGDILEHLVSPQKLLSITSKRLSPGGAIFVSLPNVANVRIRLSLLAGKFEYQKSGILDDTHLRFFTLKTSRELLSHTGFVVVREAFSHWNWNLLPRKLRKFHFLEVVHQKIKKSITSVIPGLLATQFMFKARLEELENDQS
jgi:2-polyprenyl-3-methyl-5-hydroxy-6-metoxy-1,4-benzoquinol methylase